MQFKHFFVLIAVGLMLGPGCGKDDGHTKVYPVQGKVVVNGAPAAGARVVFYPVSDDLKKPGMPVPEGTTDAEGLYHLQSYKSNDGAPIGEFKVTVHWPEPIPPNVDQEMYEPKDRLGGRYIDPQTSQLTAKVEKGGGEIPPFELQ